MTEPSTNVRLTIGDPAPPFTLIDHDGGMFSLEALLGSSVLLYFYPKDDTPGCTTEACELNAVEPLLKKRNYVIVGISPDGIDAHERFRSKYGLTFPLLSDPDHTVMERYGAYGHKMLYGKAVTGVIRSTFVIDESGVIARSFYGVKATGHAARMMRELGITTT